MLFGVLASMFGALCEDLLFVAGQAGAIRLAVSRAMLALSDSYEAPLRKGELKEQVMRSISVGIC